MALTPFDPPSSPQAFYVVPGSEDPSRVTFLTSAPLVPQDTNASLDLYQAVDGHVTLLSHDASGQAVGGMRLPEEGGVYSVTPGGQHVFFQSAKQLTAGANDGEENIYEADGTTGNVTLVSQTTAGGDPANPELREGGAVLGGGQPNLSGAVSSDGSTVFFTSRLQYDPSVPDDGVTKLFMRRNAMTTVVSASKTATPAVSSVRYEGAAADGSHVFFATPDPLTTDDQNTVQDIYEYTTAMGALTRISGGEPGFTDNTEGVDGVVAISPDASHVYFVTPDQLTASAPAGDTSGPLLYEWTPAGTTYIATLSQDDVHGYFSSTGVLFRSLIEEIQADRPARVTPDGTHLAFESHANLTSEETGNAENVYEWSDSSGLVRVSKGRINSTGLTPTYDATIGSDAGGRGDEAQPRRDYTAEAANSFGRVISDDGSHVFFSTRNALTPEATNGIRNIYEYQNGQTQLVSPNTTDAFYQDSSASGDDMFFTTAAANAPGGATAIYDARVGGGFPGPPCARENTCSAPTPPPAGEPISTQFVLPGNPAPPTPPAAGTLGATTKPAHPKAKQLTLDQKLANALRACAKKPKHQRPACIKRAHKTYAASRAHAKKTNRKGS
ncbi:MAG TPA: hypothetical protein VGX26_10250 [Solirubrobacteraceae bacterium]|nr:hypothetical protein [Solirubrobacteraceae bacterium]